MRHQGVRRWTLAVATLLIGLGVIQPVAATTVPGRDANAIVPAAFSGAMPWSQEGRWHWVEISYDGTHRISTPKYDVSIGKELNSAYFVATEVRTLQKNDPCKDCLMLSSTEQGPPSILGGPENPALRPAYQNIENGPRRQLKEDSADGGGIRWTYGSWFLNYSPITKTFFSWTWVPDDWTAEAEREGIVPDTSALPPDSESRDPRKRTTLSGRSSVKGTRVLPLRGTYRVTQEYGCVDENDGYASSASCPRSKPSFHDGLDFGAPGGTPILAAASGIVTFSGVDPNSRSGNSKIVIEHDGPNTGYRTEYLHWERSLVKAGERVAEGQEIAEVGSVGYSTGNHLHFSVYVDTTNRAVDPAAWLLSAGVSVLSGADIGDAAPPDLLQWSSLIRSAAARYGVPAELIAAVMAVESSGNPKAVSPAGAQGLMQIMPEQLTRLGVPEALWQDPKANIDAGARYLAETLNAGGSLEQAAARYFGSGCDVGGVCTDEYTARVMKWVAYYHDHLP